MLITRRSQVRDLHGPQFFYFFFIILCFLLRPTGLHSRAHQYFGSLGLYDPLSPFARFHGPFKQRKSGERGPGWLLQILRVTTISFQFQTEIDKNTVCSRYTTTNQPSRQSISSWFNAEPPEVTSKALGRLAPV